MRFTVNLLILTLGVFSTVEAAGVSVGTWAVGTSTGCSTQQSGYSDFNGAFSTPCEKVMTVASYAKYDEHTISFGIVVPGGFTSFSAPVTIFRAAQTNLTCEAGDAIKLVIDGTDLKLRTSSPLGDCPLRNYVYAEKTLTTLVAGQTTKVKLNLKWHPYYGYARSYINSAPKPGLFSGVGITQNASDPTYYYGMIGTETIGLSAPVILKTN